MSLLQLPKAINPIRCWSAIWPQLTDFPAILPSVHRLVHDSRLVEPGDAFFALQGVNQSGQDYQEQALQAGACLLVSEGPLSLKAVADKTWALSLPNLKAQLGSLLVLSAGDDFFPLATTAVTGTNGKSSVAHYLCQLRQLLSQNSMLVGTLGYGALGDLQPASHTTPDLFQLHQMYINWAQQGVQQVCLEASSHALDQGRLDGISVTTAVFTNLTRDHLDYHSSLEAYAEAKSLLFYRPELQSRVINYDDFLGRQLIDSPSSASTLSYSLSQNQADLFVSHAVFSAQGISAEVNWKGQKATLNLPLLGRFNLANLLAVLGVLLSEGHKLSTLTAYLEHLQPVKGRMQRLVLDNRELVKQLPVVVVDYAHTPDALEQALQALRLHARGRIYCVFGCGGNRDTGKRKLMAEVAFAASDLVVVTDDNPRYENPAAIRQQLLEAAPEAVEIADRAQAIDWAIQQAEVGDWVLIAGKGHEDYQEIKGQRFAFEDQKVAMQALLSRSQRC